MSMGRARGDFVASARWSTLVERLLASGDAREQLALGVEALIHSRPLVAGLIPVYPNVIADVDVDDAALVRRAWANLAAATDDQEAAQALVQAVRLVDVDLARRDERITTADPTADPVVVHGPFPALGDGELLLIRRPCRSTESADRRDVALGALRHHQLLLPLPNGLEWDVQLLGDTLDPDVRRALRAGLRAAARSGLRVSVWPSTPLASSAVATDGSCAVVDPSDLERRAIRADVTAALAAASSCGAHVLLLPELYLHADDVEHLSRSICAVAEPPLVTVVGLAHQPTGADHRWRNEALALDSDGSELWRYAKANAFIAGPGHQDGDHTGECLEVGRAIVLRHADLGWVNTSICVDTFTPDTAAALNGCLPTLSLVPSLSPSTSAHVTAALTLRASGTVTFVANRPLDATHAEAPSFNTRRPQADATPHASTVGLPRWDPGP